MKKWKRAMAVLLSCSLMGGQLLTCYGADGTQSLESYIDEGNVVEPVEEPLSFSTRFLASDSNSLYRSGGELSDEYAVMPLIVGVDDAFYIVCAVIFAACGVIVSGDNLVSLADTFYAWLKDRMQEWSDAYQAITAVRGLTFGVAVSGLKEILKAAKAFFAEIKGYGTASSSYAVSKYMPLPKTADPVSAGECAAGAYVCFASLSIPGKKSGDYIHYEMFSNIMPKAAYRETFLYGMDDTGVPLYCNIAYVTTPYEGFALKNRPTYNNFGSITQHSWPLISTYPPYNYFADIPYFSTLAGATYYLSTGTIRDMKEVIFAPSGIAVQPVVDAQTVDISDIVISDGATIPEMALLEQLLSNVATKDDIKTALKDIVALDYAGDVVIPTDVPIPSESASEGEDTSDPYLPWVPDITGRLDGILDGLGGFGDTLAGIMDSLAGFGEQVQALPGSIAHAISDVVIGTPDSSLAIDSIIVDKFPFCIPYDLVSCVTVLQAESTPPVWNVPFVIDSLNFRYEITLDLTQWTQVIAVIRGFLLLMFIVGLVILTRTLIRG